MFHLPQKIILFIILLLIIIIGISLVFWNYSINRKNTIADDSHITILPGESIESISQDLYSKKIIDNPVIFQIYLKLNKLDTTIEAGEYLIKPSVNIVDLSLLLQKGNFYINITIPAGMRFAEQADFIDKKLSENNNFKVFSKDDFVKLADDSSEFNYPFIQKGKNIEGLLFPDTYQVKKDITAEEFINMMLTNFNTKVYSKYSTLSNNNKLSFYETLTLASILEREVSTSEDRRMVADIILKRLNLGLPLGLDSTVQYMLGYSSTESSWWRQNIYQTDLAKIDPYNTRLNLGFPPTPICNPELSSIIDAMNPISNKYFYYLSDSSGKTYYAVDENGHNLNIQKYLNK